jgi:hypothetical protein
VDGILENFALSGDAPGSLEDTEATFPVPNAVWDGGIVYPVFGTNGQSKTRSKWIPLGLGHLNPGGPETTPDFIFGGTDSNGAIPVVGGLVDPIADVSAPIPLLGLEPQAITIPLAELMTLGEVYLAQPALLQGFRVQISPTGQSGIGPKATIVSTSLQGNGLRIQLGEGCGYGIGDCVPLDLTLTYPGPTGLTAVIEPRFFEVATRFVPDMLPPDSRITILFDATMADAAGQPDPTAALSTISGWHADMGDLSGTGWDFVRFEIFFEMDVSGDGWGLFDPLPSLRWLSFGFDQRL